MADAATITVNATILPDEIAKSFSGSMTVTPDDANDKWYYKLTSCTATSTDLIAGSFLDYTAVDDDTAPTAVNAADKVKFLFIQNTSSADGVVICFDGGNIGTKFDAVDENGYSTYANVTDGNVGVGVTADANGWYVYLANRSGHSVVAGFKALAITN